MNNASVTLRNNLLATYGTTIGNGGKAVVMTAADAPLMTIVLNAGAVLGTPSGGSVSFTNPQSGGGAWATFSQLPSAAGVASYVQLRTSADVDVVQASVSTIAAGTGEFQFTSTTFDTAIPATTTTAPTLTQAAS